MKDYFSWLKIRRLERAGDLEGAFQLSTRLDPRSRLFGNILKLMRLKLALATRGNFEAYDNFNLVVGTKYDSYFKKYLEYLRYVRNNKPEADALAKILKSMAVSNTVRISLPVVEF